MSIKDKSFRLMCTACSPRELPEIIITIFIAIHFEDFFDIFITILKQVSRAWSTEGTKVL